MLQLQCKKRRHSEKKNILGDKIYQRWSYKLGLRQQNEATKNLILKSLVYEDEKIFLQLNKSSWRERSSVTVVMELEWHLTSSIFHSQRSKE